MLSRRCKKTSKPTYRTSRSAMSSSSTLSYFQLKITPTAILAELKQCGALCKYGYPTVSILISCDRQGQRQPYVSPVTSPPTPLQTVKRYKGRAALPLYCPASHGPVSWHHASQRFSSTTFSLPNAGLLASRFCTRAHNSSKSRENPICTRRNNKHTQPSRGPWRRGHTHFRKNFRWSTQQLSALHLRRRFLSMSCAALSSRASPR